MTGVEHLPQGRTEGLVVVDVDGCTDTGRSERLARPAHLVADHRRPGGHRLHRHDPEVLHGGKMKTAARW